MQSDKNHGFHFMSYQDDQPDIQPGALIPRPKNELAHVPEFHPLGVPQNTSTSPYIGMAFGAVALFLLALIGTTGYGLVAQNSLVATPVVTIVDPYTNERSTLGEGPQPALEINNFFIETRDAFIDEAATFVEVDVAAEQLRYFKDGVLLFSGEIISVGEAGSWWSVPAGLYTIQQLEEEPYSNLAQVYLPYAVRFGGNYLIHSSPRYPDGSDAPVEEAVGGIRLLDEDAEQLFKLVRREIPVLVHTPPIEIDTFVYQPIVEGMSTTEYLVADVENGTVLAAGNVDQVVPIASVVKLMTAVVAAEEIDLDTRVRASAPTFVESLIPRLADRRSVSMYSLLQLLLVESSNEAAEVISLQLGRDEFIAAMNNKARQLGMFNTTFTDPSGLDAGNTSTVADLYTLAQYIQEQRSFIFEITDRSRVTNDYQGGEFGELTNFNQIEDINSFIGGKVGETSAAGQTSVSLHELTIQGDERVVAVIVLGSDQRENDVRALLEHVSASFANGPRN